LRDCGIRLPIVAFTDSAIAAITIEDWKTPAHTKLRRQKLPLPMQPRIQRLRQLRREQPQPQLQIVIPLIASLSIPRSPIEWRNPKSPNHQ